MEESSFHADHTRNGSGNAPHATGGVADSEEVGDGDPPAIPSASSSSYLTEKLVGESRYVKTDAMATEHNENGKTNTNHAAHTLGVTALAAYLKINIAYVLRSLVMCLFY